MVSLSLNTHMYLFLFLFITLWPRSIRADWPIHAHCPRPCFDYANVHSWTGSLTLGQLAHCPNPLLLRLPVANVSDGAPSQDIPVRSCRLPILTTNTANKDNQEALSSVAREALLPKRSGGLNRRRLRRHLTCTAKRISAVPQALLLARDGKVRVSEGTEARVASILAGLKLFFDEPENCDEASSLGTYGNVVVGLFVGDGIAKKTASSLVHALSDATVLSQDITDYSSHTVVESCSGGIGGHLGIVISTEGDLPGIRQTLGRWSRGMCAVDYERTLDYTVTRQHGTVFHPKSSPRWSISGRRPYSTLDSVCDHIKVKLGDSCGSLADKCGISPQDFEKFNPKDDLCSNLMEGDYVCCSEGEPFEEPKPEPPGKNEDGTCATHYVKDGDTCDALARDNGIEIDDIETWNKNTWAWAGCESLLIDYAICLSDGDAPLPPPQDDAECGPMVPGTERPSEDTSFAELNPCPLNACCSNWGFCGVFPAHCEVHRPDGDAGPGAVEKGFPSTCVSNCGTNIEENSGAPASYGRIGYYESWNRNRDCLWLESKDANMDGSYTHIHWSFLGIDPDTWKPVIEDPHVQWTEFKALDLKRIVSFGGWAYSTEAATYNIIRQAIIDHGDEFASNLADFADKHGLDGIDIDWEYPGAPDIYIPGTGDPIGREGDGEHYLNFLRTLRAKLKDHQTVSIAAPASYWYLKAFPIKDIAKVVDYIVYMTYDLHGQWDYGNPWAFDQCDSGKCIRSHINLTETTNALAMITKAGVPNNKVFVGEASYGRSFHMAVDGCWEPHCAFTGSRNKSDAAPGRCTGTRGYLAAAEISELIRKGGKQFYDEGSDSDILLYRGDYVSYMTPNTKTRRRSQWKDKKFAGTIDWAVDLQAFGELDLSSNDRPRDGQEGCTFGEDVSHESGALCAFACSLGFCPEPMCFCREEGPVRKLPDEKKRGTVYAADAFNPDLTRLCRFACKYGYCPKDFCIESVDETKANQPGYDYEGARKANQARCLLWREDVEAADASKGQCKPYCAGVHATSGKKGPVPLGGCFVHTALGEEAKRLEVPGHREKPKIGYCECYLPLGEIIAETVAEGLAKAAAIGCYLIMQTLRTVADVGMIVTGVGRAAGAVEDTIVQVVQLIQWAYDDDEDPLGAFEWWLVPCGDTESLVPDDIKKAFGIIKKVTDNLQFKGPKGFKEKKGGGRKGDRGNPTGKDRSSRTASKTRGPGSTCRPSQGPNAVAHVTAAHAMAATRSSAACQATSTPPCNVPKAESTKRLNKNTLQYQSCDPKDTTQITQYVFTTLELPKGPETTLKATCDGKWVQPCHMYSSAIKGHPEWETLTCHQNAATASSVRYKNWPATIKWHREHKGAGWRDPQARLGNEDCARDEYPPAYFLTSGDPIVKQGGDASNVGQVVRYLPSRHNTGAAGMWTSGCFLPIIAAWDNTRFLKEFTVENTDQNNNAQKKQSLTKHLGRGKADALPVFVIDQWDHAVLKDDGLRDNPCWPVAYAKNDPGFTLLRNDQWYSLNPPPQWTYNKPYKKGSNGD